MPSPQEFSIDACLLTFVCNSLLWFQLPSDPFNIDLPFTPRQFHTLLNSEHMAYPLQSPRFNNVRRAVWIMKFFVVKFLLFPVSLEANYTCESFIFKDSYSYVLPSKYVTMFNNHTAQQVQLSFYIFEFSLGKSGRQKYFEQNNNTNSMSLSIFLISSRIW